MLAKMLADPVMDYVPAKTKAQLCGAFVRADGGTRTPDPIITSDVLYQLSYVGECAWCRKVDESTPSA